MGENKTTDGETAQAEVVDAVVDTARNTDEIIDGNPAGNIDEAIQFARKYLEDILSFFGLNTDVHATTEDGEVIELDIPSTHLNGFLIGVHGDTMRALQFVVSNALKNSNYPYTRVNVDVAEYKKQRADRLAETAQAWIKSVQDTGEPYTVQPMNAADRRIVHKVAGEAGLGTESVGEGRDRHIVLRPGARDSADAEETTEVDAAKTSTETQDIAGEATTEEE